MADSIDLYFISDPGHFDGFLSSTSLFHPTASRMKTVSDMIDQIVPACKTAKLGELTVVGHGNPFGQYVGTDWLDKDTLESFRSSLKRLVPLWGSDSLLTMGGCEQGQNGSFLLALSDIVDVPVRGFTALQRSFVPGNQGGETKCYLTCARSERTFWDKYIDPINHWMSR